jgi:hypothetical protein
MRLSRKAKRYDDSALPCEFKGFERFHEGTRPDGAMFQGAIRRREGTVEVAELSLECLAPKKQSFSKLRNKAEGLTEQINYLRERLEVVDHDRRGMYVQLRSLPPYKDDTQIQFNEISIGRNKVVVKRIAFFRKDETKHQVPLRLSEDQLQRLLHDLRDLI